MLSVPPPAAETLQAVIDEPVHPSQLYCVPGISMGSWPSLLKLNKLHYPLACYQADPLSSWTCTTAAVLVWPCSWRRSPRDATAAWSKCFLPTYLLCLGTAEREIGRWVAKRGDTASKEGEGIEKIRLEGPAGWSWLCMGQCPWIQQGNDF